MATSLVIEEESGTTVGLWHSHNGYYAGDFRDRPASSPRLTSPRTPTFRGLTPAA
jgi:hypothetical protein